LRVTEGLSLAAKSDDLVRLKEEIERLIDERLSQAQKENTERLEKIQEEITQKILARPNE